MRIKKPLQFGGYNHELESSVRELDQMHNDHSLRAMESMVDELVDQIRETKTSFGGRQSSRRNFLLGVSGVAIGGVALAACGTSAASKSSSSTTLAAKPQLTGDLLIAALAASLENLGIYAYNAGINAAIGHKLGAVPPAVVTFAKTAMAQHKDHAAAWNSILVAAGESAVTKTDPALTPTVNQAFAKVVDVTGLAKLALDIEDIAAATYQGAVGALSSNKAVAIAASIQPVEMQHAAILNFVLGQYPVPNAFSPLTDAQPPSSYLK